MAPLRVTICGGGNGAHVMAGLASTRENTEVTVLELYQDFAEKWWKNLNNGPITVVTKSGNINGKPKLVTNDPKKALSDADIIIITVPAFAHEQYFIAMKEYMKPGTVIVGLPGSPGFEFASLAVIGDKLKQCTLLTYETLPWACRIEEYGKRVNVLTTKGTMKGAIRHPKIGPKPNVDPVAMFQSLLGKEPVCNTFGDLLGITLMSVNSYLHTSIMYGRWHDWDGKSFDKAPLFYQGIDGPTADLLSAMSDEIITICQEITKKHPQVNLKAVTHILEWFRKTYENDITDPSTLENAIRSNAGYNGLTHPCKKSADGKLEPNFGYRYLTEDIPFGLTVTKGIAELAGVPTPNIDKVLTWGQERLGKQYIVDGKLKGNDLKDTRCPQKYGFKNLEEII